MKTIKIGKLLSNCKEIFFDVCFETIEAINKETLKVESRECFRIIVSATLNKKNVFIEDSESVLQSIKKGIIAFERGVKKEKVVRLIEFHEFCRPKLSTDLAYTSDVPKFIRNKLFTREVWTNAPLSQEKIQEIKQLIDDFEGVEI